MKKLYVAILAAAFLFASPVYATGWKHNKDPSQEQTQGQAQGQGQHQNSTNKNYNTNDNTNKNYNDNTAIAGAASNSDSTAISGSFAEGGNATALGGDSTSNSYATGGEGGNALSFSQGGKGGQGGDGGAGYGGAGGDSDASSSSDQSQTQSANNEGVNTNVSTGETSQSTTVNNVEENPDNIKIRNTPDAYAPPVVPTSPCRIGGSAGLALPGLGASLGGTKMDWECNTRETAHAFAQLGAPAMGLLLLCKSEAVTSAKNGAGLSPEQCEALVSAVQNEDYVTREDLAAYDEKIDRAFEKAQSK